jgi:hypothetical protein
MSRSQSKFSDEIRHAINASPLSRYKICKVTGIAESLMSRFMNGRAWLGQDNLDAVAKLLDLHVAAGKPRRPPKKG